MGQSTLERRRASKALRKINELEARAGRTQSSAAAQGTQKLDWTDNATIALFVFAVALILAVALGHVVWPGGVVLVLAYNMVKPRRTIALSKDGVSIWAQSAWTGSVTGLIGVYPRNALQLGTWTTVGDHPPVKLGDDVVEHLNAVQQQFGPIVFTSADFVPPPPSMANPL